MIKKFLDDIKRVRKQFSEIIIDAQQETNDYNITWPNYTAGISKKLYAKEFEHLRNTRQYSLMLQNKGLIQFFYNFKQDNSLNKARLAYYPYPIAVKEPVEVLEDYFSDSDDLIVAEYYYDLSNLAGATLGNPIEDPFIKEISGKLEELGKTELEALEEQFNLKYLLTNTSHIRFDFDSEVTTHHKFEIQYSSINTIRIPSNKLVSPFIFMDFIVRNEFKEFYLTVHEKAAYKTAFSLALKNSTSISDFCNNNIYLHHDT